MTHPTPPDFLDQEALTRIVTKFYEKLFKDPIISHLFFGVDETRLVSQSILFTAQHLGMSASYQGPSLVAAHTRLKLKAAHLRRRHLILAETLVEQGLEDPLKSRWLEVDAALTLVLARAHKLSLDFPLAQT